MKYSRKIAKDLCLDSLNVMNRNKVGKFVSLVIVSLVGDVTDKINLLTEKVRVVYTNLGHLWRQHNVRLRNVWFITN